MADPILLAPSPEGRVLPTLNADGSRRWIRPKPSPGVWWRRRRAVAWALMAIFLVVPYLRMNGRPLVLLDLPRRRFDLFGTTFLPTDTVLFQLLFIGVVIAILLFTALFGRVWCGWGCPQTVYMEFLFRPIERFVEGGFLGSRRLDATKGPHVRRLVKHAIFAVVAVVLAHTFLGYFVGVETLARWVRLSPVEHPTAFLVMLGTTALIFLDFAYFREQTCLVACPYGRLQSVLLDIWQTQRITALMVTHDVDEALFLSDRVAMMTSGPRAKLGAVLDVPFERPRSKTAVLDHPDYYALRDELIGFLEGQEHGTAGTKPDDLAKASLEASSLVESGSMVAHEKQQGDVELDMAAEF